MFETDPFPGKPKILFIGHPSSSHTVSWIDLLKGQEFNIRLFGLPTGLPPDDWSVRTYVTIDDLPYDLDVNTRLWFYPRPQEKQEVRQYALTLEAIRQNLDKQINLSREVVKATLNLEFDQLKSELIQTMEDYLQQNREQSLYYQSKVAIKRIKRLLSPSKSSNSSVSKIIEDVQVGTGEPGFPPIENSLEELIPPQPVVQYSTRFPTIEDWLADIIREWQPDIIHTLGLDPAGYFYHKVRREYKLAGIGKWMLQLRGGSDLTLTRFDPDVVEQIRNALNDCDQIISDNLVNFQYARELYISEDKFAPISPVPGTGGIDINQIVKTIVLPPSKRRDILWPKAYDSPWSLASPVLEAIKLSWEKIQPCQIHMLAVSPETRMWIQALPGNILERCFLYDRIDRSKALQLMTSARVMLAPSLVDGVPNTMYEAMAAGALPIVSPLETIIPVVKPEVNVLFARNLYPEEIASMIIRAMNDDILVDAVANQNLSLVRSIADHEKISERVVDFYQSIASPVSKKINL